MRPARLAGIGGQTEYQIKMAAAIAAARRNNAALWFAGAPSDLGGFVFQDSTGTTPATGTDPIGLPLDRSYGTGNLGAELITNGDFSAGLTNWSANTTCSVVAGELNMVANGSGANASQTISTVVGAYYKVSGTLRKGGASPFILIGAAYIATPSLSSVPVQIIVQAGSTSTTITLGTPADNNGLLAYFDNISVKQVLGFPALQATAADKPTLELQANGYYGWRNGLTDRLVDGLVAQNSDDVTLITVGKSTAGDGVASTFATAGGSTSTNVPRVAQMRSFGTTSVQFIWNTDAAVTSVVTATISANEFCTLVGVKNGSNATVSKNGAVIGGPTAITAGTTTVNSGYIGGTSTGADPLLGLLMLVCKSRNAMSAPDIAAIVDFGDLLRAGLI